MKRLVATVLFAAALGGCATLGGLTESPRVSLVGIEPVDFQLFEQRYRVTLRIQNPNDLDISIRGLDYEIVVNDRVFARGVSGKPITVPAWGESIAEVEVVTTLWRVMEQLEQLGVRDELSLDYMISGRVNVDGIPVPVPFDHQDTLRLPGTEKREKRNDDTRPPKPATIAI